MVKNTISQDDIFFKCSKYPQKRKINRENTKQKT